MSALPVETIEPDPAATSLPTDETVSTAGVDQSAPTDKDAVVADVKPDEVKGTNGSADVKEAESTEKSEEKTVEKTDKSENNGHKRAPYKKEFERDSNQPRRTHFNSYPKGPNHSKYDPSVLESTGDHKQIRAQVEFYFGDANLPTDQFLWELTDGAKNLPVPIATICKFGRMKRFEPVSAVVEALRQSPLLIVEGSEGEETVKRKTAYNPSTTRSGALLRSVYVKGFGNEEKSSQFDIEAFFAPFGPTNAVRLRRTNEKEFKGSVFVEFADEETAIKFLALDPKPKWKGTEELEFKSKKEYTDGKELDIKEGRMEPSESWVPGNRGGRGGRGNSRGGRGEFRGRGRGGNFRGDRDRGGRGGRDRGDRGDKGNKGGDRDPDDWKKRREDDRASGFKGDKKGDRRGGRGGNRGGRDDRGPRDRNNEREEGNATNEEKTEKTEDSSTNEKKRAREEDAGSEQPAKKVDTKPEPTAAS